MAYTLPNIEAPGPGGRFIDAYKAGNEAKEGYLRNKLLELTNQYYGPNLESEMANRNALTKQYEINNLTLNTKNILANELARLQNQEYVPNAQSARALQFANTNQINQLLPEQVKKLQQQNAFYPQLMQAEMNYKNMGGGRIGTGTKEEFIFRNFVGQDNPQLNNDPDKIYEASNVLREGGNRLNDGTLLNPLSPAARGSLDRLIKSGTYAGSIVPLQKAQQADKELKIFSKNAAEFLAPYGTTYFGKSFEQIADTFKNDKESQTRLGKFIAGQALQYEIAQIRNRIARGAPGITATNELMKEAQQHIKASYPRLSATARKVANDNLDRVIQEGLEASKSAGIHISELFNNNDSSKRNQNKYTEEDIKHTAEKYGISEEEVRKRAGL